MFYKDYLKKPIAIFSPIYSTFFKAKSLAKLFVKILNQKQNQPIKISTIQSKKSN